MHVTNPANPTALDLIILIIFAYGYKLSSSLLSNFFQSLLHPNIFLNGQFILIQNYRQNYSSACFNFLCLQKEDENILDPELNGWHYFPNVVFMSWTKFSLVVLPKYFNVATFSKDL
jgi:hypothetical protein